MTLQDLAQQLKNQAQSNNTLVLDTTLLTADQVADIKIALLLSDDNLTISGVAPTDIPDPQGDTLTITAGTAGLLNLTAVSMQLIFTVDDSSQVQVVIVAALPVTWTFKDSFANLDLFPFNQLSDLQNSYCIYATQAQDTYTPWADKPEETIALEAGLNFAGWLTLDGFSSILTLLGDIVGTTTTYKLYGTLAPAPDKPYPVTDLTALLSEKAFSIGYNPFILSLSQPQLLVKITEPTGLIQDIGLALQATFSSSNNAALDFSVGIPAAGNTLSFYAAPPAGQSFTAEDILQLAGGKTFTDYIPDELNDIFKEVGLNYYNMVMLMDTKKVGYIELSIGTVKSWEILKDVITLENLALQLSLLDPAGTSALTTATVKATASLLPTIFTGEFDFSVSIQKPAKGSATVTTISGQYYGSVVLGDLVKGILGESGAVPSVLNDIVFADFGVVVDRTSNSYSCYGTCECNFPMLDTELVASLTTKFDYNGSYSVNLLGALAIGEEDFSLTLDLGNRQDQKMTASWTAQGDAYLQFEDIASAFGFTIPAIPEDLDLALKSASFTYDFTNKTLVLKADSANWGKAVFVTFQDAYKKSQYFFGLALDALDLSDLPLVGSAIGDTLSLQQIQCIITSAAISKDTASTLNGLIGSDYPQVPSVGMEKGINFSLEIDIAGHKIPLHVGTGSKQSSSDNDQPTDNASAAFVVAKSSSSLSSSSTTSWYNVQKTIGPLALNRVGMSYAKDKLWLLLDGGLNTKVLAIDLLGLGAGIDISDPNSPSFQLNGLSVQLQVDPLSISGTFLKNPSPGDDITEEYDGELGIQVSSFSLTAYGSYAQLTNGNTSLFAFAVIDYPLGGPASFFITGGALGFGYNRDLTLPSIDTVSTYPLVVAATSPSDYKNLSLAEVLAKMEAITPVLEGQYWLAAGIKFTTYEMLQSFALVSVSFGVQLEIALIGLSTARIPTIPAGESTSSVPAIAEAQLALEVRILPDEGLVAVEAMLTPNSYVLSKDCHLTGGFAFYVWFGSNPYVGDFVITLGGYHPDFKKPSHYPDVDRLGMNWDVGDGLTIKGGLYFALTPVCIMAGGQLAAVWQSGGIKAWFDLYADILIFWKPFHYDIDAGVDIGVTAHAKIVFVTISITVHVGASLHIWGPDFSGKAKIHLWFISFTISFGGSSSQTSDPIAWSEFKTSFLGDKNKICTLAASSGLLKTISSGDDTVWIMDPEHFALTTGSLIPTKQLQKPGQSEAQAVDSSYNTDFGVGMVRVASDDFHTIHKISLQKDGEDYGGNTLTYTPITNAISKSLWQNIASNQLYDQAVSSSDTTLPNAVIGYTITPAVQAPDQTLPVTLANLLFQPNDTEKVIVYDKPSDVPTSDSFDQSQAITQISDTIASNNTTRDDLLELLQNQGFDVPATVDVQNVVDNIDNYFVESPILSLLGEERTIKQAA